MRWVTLALGAGIVLLQADLWFGRGSLPHVWELQAELARQRAANDGARERNARLAAEVADLKEGLEMIEDRARGELGMVRPDEILVQVTARR